MEPWYLYVLASMGAYIVQGVFLKWAAVRGVDEEFMAFVYLSTVACISLALVLVFGFELVTFAGIVAAFVNGVFYSLATMTRLGALKVVPASIVYPLMALKNALLVPVFVLFLEEPFTLSNLAGVVLAFLSLYLISQGDAA